MLNLDTGLVGAAVFALASAAVLIPLAKAIPAAIERGWRAELETFAREAPAAASSAELTLAQKIAVVVATLLLSLAVAAVHGTHAHGIALMAYGFALLLLLVINLKHQLLPDVVVLSTLWAGLLYHAQAGNATEYLHGAVAAYLVPWLLVGLVRAVKRVDILSPGDTKTLAMAGAWFGIDAVPTLLVVFVVSAVAYAIVVAMRRPGPHLVPTGPAHMLAGLVLVFGPRLSLP